MLFVYRFGIVFDRLIGESRRNLLPQLSKCLSSFQTQQNVKQTNLNLPISCVPNSYYSKQYFHINSYHRKKNGTSLLLSSLLSSTKNESFMPKCGITVVPNFYYSTSSCCFMTTKSGSSSHNKHDDNKKMMKHDFHRNKLKIKTEKYKEKFKDLVEDGEEASKRMLNKLQNRVYTLPNILCMFRIGCTPVIGTLIVMEQFDYALGLCTISAVTDFLDGWIARNFNSESKLGALLDPLADKLLVATLTFTLTYVHLIPIWLTGLILLRDLLIILGGLYMHFRMIVPPITRAKFFDFTAFRSDRFKPTLISKVNTGMQLSLVVISLASPLFQQFFIDYHFLLTGLQITTGITTLFSGLNYLRRLK